MKEKVIAGSLVIFSVFAGIIGSYIFLYILNPGFQNFTSSQPRDVVREEKFITITELQSEITTLVKDVWPSVVNIIIKKDLALYRRDPWGFFQEQVGSVERQVGGWSGFFVTKEWIIMTNKHVVEDQNASYTVITNDGTEYEASVVALDPLTDLAIIKINNIEWKEFQTIDAIVDEESIQIGQFAIAIGNALWEFQNSVAFGVISGKNRSIEAGSQGSRETQRLSWLLQTDTAINPGNSGGPLLNARGEVVGINTIKIETAEGMGFAIPINIIAPIANSFAKNGKYVEPHIGIYAYDKNVIQERTKQDVKLFFQQLITFIEKNVNLTIINQDLNFLLFQMKQFWKMI